MTTPTPEPAADPAEAVKTAVKHLLWGAIPTVAALVAIILQASTSFVGSERQWLFEITVQSCMMLSLTIWIWCTVIQVRRQFKLSDEVTAAAAQQRLADMSDDVEDRFDSVDAGLIHVENIVIRIESSVRGIHKRIDQLAADHETLKQENAHLRALIIQSSEPEQFNGKRLGPRSLS